MRSRQRVRSKNDLQSRNLESLFEEVVISRNHLLDRGKHFFRIARRACELVFVEQIILHHESRLRIEPHAFLYHQLQIVVSREWPMLDLRAACDDGRTNGVFVRVYERAQAELLRFITRRVELFLREQHLRTPDTARSKDLDQVSARFFLFSDEGANLIGRAGLFAATDEWLSGSQDTWTRQRASRNSITQRQIVWRADTLNGREAGHECRPCVSGGCVSCIGAGAAGARVFSVWTKAPGNVDVAVNPTGQHG